MHLAKKAIRFVENPFHLIPKGIENIIQSVAPIVLSAVGQPELAAAYSGLNTYAHGGSLGKSLLNAGLSYGGSALGGSDTVFGNTFSGPISGVLNGLGDTASSALGDIGKATGLSSIYKDASGALSDGYHSISDALGSQYNSSTVQDAFHSGQDALNSISPGLGGGGVSSASTTGAALSPQGGGGSSYGNVGTFGQDSGIAGTTGLLDKTSNALPSLDDINKIGGSIGNLNTNPSIGLSNNSLNTGANIGGKVASSNYLSPIASLGIGSIANNSAQNALLKQANANKSLLAPYLNFKFNPSDLQNDPGYQFNLSQGNQALDRRALAPGGGGYFSGAALKDAQTFGQGLADNTYNSAFNRALQSNNAGLTGALATAGVNDSIGNTKAAGAINEGNLFSGALGNVLGGNSYTNNGSLQGGSDIQALIKRLFGNSNSNVGNYAF